MTKHRRILDLDFGSGGDQDCEADPIRELRQARKEQVKVFEALRDGLQESVMGPHSSGPAGFLGGAWGRQAVRALHALLEAQVLQERAHLQIVDCLQDLRQVAKELGEHPDDSRLGVALLLLSLTRIETALLGLGTVELSPTQRVLRELDGAGS